MTSTIYTPAQTIVDHSSIVGAVQSMSSELLSTAARFPNRDDVYGYTAGSSIWIAPDDTVWQLDSIVDGAAHWLPATNPGRDAASIIPSGLQVAAGTRRLISSYTGALFDVTRVTDLHTLTVNTLGDGSPDISALAAFLAPTGGVGYVSKLYDQSGTDHLTQTVIASMPRIDMTTVIGNNVPLLFDHVKRTHDIAQVTSYPVTYPGTGAVVTYTGGTVPLFILPGQTVTGTNIPANTTISSINYSSGAITLSASPTGAVTAITITQLLPTGVALDIPSTASVSWRNWSVIMGVQFGPISTFYQKPIIWGVSSLGATAAAGSWAGVMTQGLNKTGLRPVNGNNIDSNIGYGDRQHNSPQVFAYAMGGSTGRDMTYQLNGKIVTVTNAIASPPATTLTGGAIGNHQQFLTGSGPVGDFILFDFIGVNATLAASDIKNATAAICIARGWKPQVRKTFVADGSSTTVGSGCPAPLAWPYQVTRRLAKARPMVAIVPSTGGTTESMVGLFDASGPGLGAGSYMDNDLLVVHWGQGNSMQAGTSLTVTATDTNTGTLTVTPGTTNTVFTGLNALVSGTNIVPGSRIIGYTATTVTISPPPTGNVTSITCLPDTGANLYETVRQYVQKARADGYQQIVGIGSASRKTFTAPQLAEFNNWKVMLQEGWKALGLDGFVDFELEPYFGDGGGMTVRGVDPVNRKVTVAALSPYAAAGNRIRWPGMPFDLTNNTGGQTITAVSGTTLTLSGSTRGIAPGTVIRAINPAPWTTYPSAWLPDGQHFTPFGYQVQADTIAHYLLANDFV